MGTFYTIKFESDLNRDSIKYKVDSLLNSFENELSTYRPKSTISQFNTSQKGISIDTLSQFYKAFSKAKKLYKETNGYFDPTISPLVNYYGFGYDKQMKKEAINSDTISSLINLVGMQKLREKRENGMAFIFKFHPDQQLDLSASAKGGGVDFVAEYLKSSNISNFMVEIGGEVYATGKNEKGLSWTIGISNPSPGSSPSDILIPLQISSSGLASSGNYRNFYQSDSLTFAHIINAKTGLSQPTDILSTTVLAEDCETADAFATAFMAMGLEKSIDLTHKLKHIKTCFIYFDERGDSLAFKFSNGFEQNLIR